MNNKFYKYEEIKTKIDEGDILLFRGKGLIAKLIGSSTKTPYSHIGVASWTNGNVHTQEGILECIEFREGSLLAGIFGLSGGGGGRSVNLCQQVKKYSGCIDVYRPNPIFFNYTVDKENKSFILTKKDFDGKKVTATMRRMTGLPYGWRRIWWMFKHQLLMYKFFGNRDSLINDQLQDIIYPVCSTAVAYSFNSNGYDLVNNRSDQWTEPGDIALSTNIHYLGTLLSCP